MRQKLLIRVLGLALLFCAPGAFGDHADGGAIGLIGGAGFGGRGYEKAEFDGYSPGLTWKIAGIPIFWGLYAHINPWEDRYGIGFSGDLYFIDSFAARSKHFDLDWFLGVGWYAGFWFYGYGPVLKDGDELRLNAGVRVPLGLAWHVTEDWEIFLNLAPVAGFCIMPVPRYPRLYWDAGAELGIRYWL